MIWFDEELKGRIRQNDHESMMYERYVDDITAALRNDWKMPNENDDGKDDARALECILEIGNGIHRSLQLTGDAPSLHEDRKMPTLDLGLWTGERYILDVGKRCAVMHDFYAKDVSAKHVTHARSAMPPSMKRTIITQELLRVMLRCSPLLEWDRVVEHLNAMMKRLQFSGYGHEYRSQVLKSALKAYDSIKQKDADGVEPMYRPRDWNRQSRENMKKCKKESWFKTGGAETVIFIPNTPGSVLKKRYMEEVGKSGLKVKVVEGTGRSIKNILQKSDPFNTTGCQPPQRDECPVCVSGNGGCRREGVTYEITCGSCSHVYVGETADNAHHRGKQHAYGLRRKYESNALYKHVVTEHAEDPPPVFSMKVTGTFGNDCLLRQVTEARLIDDASTRGECMNSRAEWNHQSVPRITIVDD